jgi:crotonobetainyl-CoA:carnitine CoA-transferase CaiB-like acyl-CoA transferase
MAGAATCGVCERGAWPSLWTSAADREREFKTLCQKHAQELAAQREALAAAGRTLDAADRDPAKKAELDAKIKAAIEKGRRDVAAYRASQRSGGCQCCCCRRY